MIYDNFYTCFLFAFNTITLLSAILQISLQISDHRDLSLKDKSRKKRFKLASYIKNEKLTLKF